MKIYRGKIHAYLGMTLNFSEPVEVKITMILYVEEMFKELSNHDDTVKTSSTSVSDQLFKTIEDAILLE